MIAARTDDISTEFASLEAAAALARGGFACMFSTSDEYETELIRVRRAQGRYDPASRNWLTPLLAGLALTACGIVLLSF